MPDRRFLGLVLGLAAALPFSTRAEDGYRLWLRYERLPAQVIDGYRARLASVVVQGGSATLDAIRRELVDGFSGLLGQPVPLAEDVDRDGAVVVGTPRSSPVIAGLGWGRRLAELGPDGFRVHSVRLGGRPVTVIASDGEFGALYGAFHFLRLVQTLRPLVDLDVSQRPRLRLRVLDHWDNLDGSIERGYAGRSLWDWKELPEKPGARLRDYARASASVGVNGSVLNSVNARSEILGAGYLRKVAAIAAALRPYGVRVYLSARFQPRSNWGV